MLYKLTMFFGKCRRKLFSGKISLYTHFIFVYMYLSMVPLQTSLDSIIVICIYRAQTFAINPPPFPQQNNYENYKKKYSGTACCCCCGKKEDPPAPDRSVIYPFFPIPPPQDFSPPRQFSAAKVYNFWAENYTCVRRGGGTSDWSIWGESSTTGREVAVWAQRVNSQRVFIYRWIIDGKIDRQIDRQTVRPTDRQTKRRNNQNAN